MRYAVAYYDFDSNLEVKIVHAKDWKEALGKATGDTEEDLCVSDDIEKAKDEAAQQDWAFDVVEIPD